MSKKHLFFYFFIILIFSAYIYWVKFIPTHEESIHHQALFCSTLQRKKNDQNHEDLLEKFHFLFNNSTPTYAYHKPKFYEQYAQKLIHHYLDLPKAQKQIAQQNYEKCRVLIQP